VTGLGDSLPFGLLQWTHFLDEIGSFVLTFALILGISIMLPKAFANMATLAPFS